MSDFKFITYGVSASLATLTINRPPYNVLDIATMREINSALDLLMEDKTAKALVITGAGEKTFSSGVDVIDHTPDKVVEMIDVFHGILKRLLTLPIPTVAALNGPALGGGCELAIACDMVVASENAKLGQPEIKLGVFPPIAAIILPRLLPMTKVMELMLSGDIIDAREAQSLGLVNRVFPKESFAADVAKYLEKFTSLSRVALVHTKRAVKEAATRPFYEALFHVEQLYLKELMATADAKEGLAAFIEKRKPVWQDK
ncbi:MAG: enoyl-CoA hydratase/isomerase family protein [Rhodocyclales bacterium]|nr:enoyl-CoA hydratase/isomerase family protein [Rhodocyclales bacterium]